MADENRPEPVVHPQPPPLRRGGSWRMFLTSIRDRVTRIHRWARNSGYPSWVFYLSVLAIILSTWTVLDFCTTTDLGPRMVHEFLFPEFP